MLNTRPHPFNQELSLVSIEQKLAALFQSSIEIGGLMEQIKNHKLFSPLYPSFKDYVETRWGLDQDQITEMVNVKAVIEDLKDNLPSLAIPTSPDQIREYFDLTREQRIELAKRVAGLGCERMTRELIHQCRLELFPQTEDYDDKPQT